VGCANRVSVSAIARGMLPKVSGNSVLALSGRAHQCCSLRGHRLLFDPWLSSGGGGTHGGGKPARIEREHVQTTSTGSATSGSTAPTRRRHVAAVAVPARDRAGMNIVHSV